jgi:hypothetical protein
VSVSPSPPAEIEPEGEVEVEPALEEVPAEVFAEAAPDSGEAAPGAEFGLPEGPGSGIGYSDEEAGAAALPA